MAWFKKALQFLKDHQPGATRPAFQIAESVATEVPSFTKLAVTMAKAGAINVEQGVAKTFRAITGKTNFLKAHNAQEGPLKSSVSLQDLAQLAQGAYSEDGGGRMGYDTVVTRQVDDLSFSLYRNQEDGHVVVAFRGTDSFSNWKRNLDFQLVDDGFGHQVHGGFKGAWDRLKPEVDKELYDLLGSHTFTDNVTFTGHSLGGAIAQLATGDYVTRQDARLIDTVTFAAPTVGDQSFLDSIPGGHMMNVVDPRDSVPKVVQVLQPKLKNPDGTVRAIAIGDKAARINDEVKKDAIKFGIDVAFDFGIMLMLAYAPEALAAGGEGAAAAGAEAGEGIAVLEDEAFALEESLVSAAQKAAGVGAEETALIESIGGGGETITTAQRADISVLFNSETRASIIKQLANIDVAEFASNTVRNAVGGIDWEATVTRVMVGAGVSESARNLITPFIMENVSGLEDASPEQVHFLLKNSFDYMYGAAAAHPMTQYIKNIDTRFGDQRINARDDMWQNYIRKLDAEGKDMSHLLEFMTDEELESFREEFAHDVGDDDPDEDADEDTDEIDGDIQDVDEDVAEDDAAFGRGFTLSEAPTHNLSGHEANEINGRPLQVLTEGQGRKADGSRIYAVVTEEGETLAYTGPAHPASTTTLFGKWTGVAPFANDLPTKVSRQNAFGGQGFSALDTFSLAYLVNSYNTGYHNAEADQKYIKRINAALSNGFISESIDGDELRAARLILREFEENGHLFGADNSVEVKGNLLTEISAMSRGDLSGIGDDVTGIPVAFSLKRKRRIEDLFYTPQGSGIARDIMEKDARRLKSSEVSDANLIDEGVSTVEFNMRALRNLGMENSPEYAILNNGAKQTSLAYKTALNIESKLSDLAASSMRRKGDGSSSTGPASLFPNVLSQYTSRDVNVKDDMDLGGSEEYFKDLVVKEILKSIV